MSIPHQQSLNHPVDLSNLSNISTPMIKSLISFLLSLIFLVAVSFALATYLYGASIQPITSQKSPQYPEQIYQALTAAEDPEFFRGFWARNQCLVTHESCRGGLRSWAAKMLVNRQERQNQRPSNFQIKWAATSLKVHFVIQDLRVMDYVLKNSYFGRRAEGLADASSAYFDKTPDEAELHEAALLMALLRSPTDLANNPAKAKTRRDKVLQQMFDLGFITQSELRQATSKPLGWSSK